MGELEIASNPDGEAFVFSGEPMFQHMSGVSGRQLNSTVQQVFHNSLTQNFPNPFNPQTTLAYSLREAANVTLAIYDVGGRRVRVLVNEHLPAGAYKVTWDGTDAKGSGVASGVYFCKLVAGSFADTKKMVMLK
jgi:flagellar hook assembly protein FlgD